MSGSSLACVLADGLDRELFAEALAREPALARAAARAGRLLPHPEALLGDLFAALFKLNVVLLPASELSPTVLVHRRLIEAAVAAPGFERLRARAALDQREAGALAGPLSGLLLDALTRDHRVLPDELVDLAAAAHDEEALARLDAHRAHLDGLPAEVLGEAERGRLRRALESGAEALARRLGEARRRHERLAAGLPPGLAAELAWKLERLDGQIDEAEAAARGLGLGGGADGRLGAAERLELGERLLASRKLRLLARLVGAFREVAFEARRRRLGRAPQELHDVRRGTDLGRLLPSELPGLDPRRRALHLDFLRRFAEGELLVYDVHAAADRGPMVVCVDGSGSMAGSKELWAKAVALTLMEIARRERRRCLALVFSAGSELFEAELLARGIGRRRRGIVRDEAVLRFAEHFPGGGTSFEEPLARAVDAVSTGSYRRGDIVFVTDGEAQVTDALVARVARARRRHRFRIRGVLVDVASARRGVLERFCDDVRRVTDLTADSMADLFASL